MNKKSFPILAVAIAALAAGYWFGTGRQPETSKQPQGVVSTTPTRLLDFTLPDLEGKKHNLSDWQGKVIVVNFWATWCPPCRTEIPMFLEYYAKYRDRGLVFIGVAIDKKEDVETYVDTMFIDYPILLGNETSLDLMTQYGNRVGSLPYNVLIDRNGDIVNTKKGSYTHAELEKLLKPLF